MRGGDKRMPPGCWQRGQWRCPGWEAAGPGVRHGAPMASLIAGPSPPPTPAPVILSTLLHPSQPPEDRLQLRHVPPYPGTVTQAGRAPSVFSTTVY